MVKKYIGKNSNIRWLNRLQYICTVIFNTALNIMYVLQRFISIEKSLQGIDKSKYTCCMILFWERRECVCVCVFEYGF